MESSAGGTKPPCHCLAVAAASYSGQMALRNWALALSAAGSSASTSTVPKSFGSTVRVRVMVSPFTVMFTSCPPEEALYAAGI